MAERPHELHADDLHARGAKPACVPACPTGASSDDDGIVWVEPTSVHGPQGLCKRLPVWRSRLHQVRGLHAQVHVLQRPRARGRAALLREDVPSEGLVFGDLDDPNSEVSKLVGKFKTERIHEDLGTSRRCTTFVTWEVVANETFLGLGTATYLFCTVSAAVCSPSPWSWT